MIINLDAYRQRIGFATLQDAVWYCIQEQLDFERWRSTPPSGGAA